MAALKSQRSDMEATVMDDVIVFGRTTEENNKRLKLVLKQMEEAEATLNRAKCSFGQSKIKFLGVV